MADIATRWDIGAGAGDWGAPQPGDLTWTDAAGVTHPADGDLFDGDDLLTAVLISLFSDAEAGPDDVIPDGSGDPRGWWAGPIGSKIWLRARSKEVAVVPELVRDDIQQALAWLIEDDVAASVVVTTEFTRPGMLGARVEILRNDGTRQALAFSRLWETI